MIRRFIRSRSGNFAILTSVLSIPLILAMGLAVDYSRYLDAKRHMQDVADATSLALAGSQERDEAAMRVDAQRFVDSNFDDASIDQMVIAGLDITENDVTVKLDGYVHTTFMAIAGHDKMPVAAESLAIRAVTGSVEVALVLDNTDSMNEDNKIGTLKTAAGNLVKELFKNKDAKVRIALVPYAEQINVGMANRNKSWLSVPNDYDKVVVTEVPAKEGYWTQPMKNTSECETWQEAGSKQVEKDGIWYTETWDRRCTKYKQVPNGPEKWVAPVPAKTTTTTTKYRWFGCVGSRVNNKLLVLNDQNPTIKYPGYVNTSQKCLTEVLPLSENEATVQSAVTGMITSRSGYTPQTYIPGGMMWGINVLSNTAPYEEGLAYDPDNKSPRKVIVLMTDGLNTRRVNVTGTANMDYLNGGALIGDTNSANANQRIATNTDTTTLCNYAKENKIEIFTVAFQVDDGAAKTMLEGCATSKEHYYDASDPAKLLAAFSGIAQSLSVVRLAR
ncbi:MAG: TadE/TadG family type IV pilus assembly protein [Mesorhizobium sp.]